MYTHVSVRMYRCCVGSLCMYFQFCLFFVIVCIFSWTVLIFVYDFENHNYYLLCCAGSQKKGKQLSVGGSARGNAVAVKGTVDGLPSGIFV